MTHSSDNLRAVSQHHTHPEETPKRHRGISGTSATLHLPVYNLGLVLSALCVTRGSYAQGWHVVPALSFTSAH